MGVEYFNQHFRKKKKKENKNRWERDIRQVRHTNFEKWVHSVLKYLNLWINEDEEICGQEREEIRKHIALGTGMMESEFHT